MHWLVGNPVAFYIKTIWQNVGSYCTRTVREEVEESVPTTYIQWEAGK